MKKNPDKAKQVEYTAEEERIFELARQIKEVRERCLFVCGPIPCACPHEVKKLRQEIEAMGYYVITEGIVDPKTLEPRIGVKIFKPKDDLPPDLAKIYDDWLMARRLEFNEADPAKKEGNPPIDEEFLKKAGIKIV